MCPGRRAGGQACESPSGVPDGEVGGLVPRHGDPGGFSAWRNNRCKARERRTGQSKFERLQGPKWAPLDIACGGLAPSMGAYGGL